MSRLRSRWFLFAPVVVPLLGGLWQSAHVRSPAVRAWRRPSLPTVQCGPLVTRTGGEGPRGVVLLHGLVATGDVFSVVADELTAHARVAVPDLLGFGRSLDEDRSEYSTTAHLDALSAVIDEVIDGRRFVIGAHSMGSALAMRLALRYPGRVDRVVCVGAPIWPDPRRSIGATGMMARALLLDERVARQFCQWGCRHRWAAGWIAAVAAPRWPIPISRQASLHTWPAYQQAVEQQVLDVDWRQLLSEVDRIGVRVTLVWGHEDPIGDPSYARALTGDLDTIDIEIIPGVGHTAPVTRPDLFTDRFRRALANPPHPVDAPDRRAEQAQPEI